jgi:hypothetical protein
MLCELIALGCLTAHGDIEATTKLRNEWSADKIIDRLDSLHPHFYPLPVHQKFVPGPPVQHWHLEPVSNGWLTRAELLTLNGKSGDTLHRGSMKKLLSPRTPIQTNFPDIASWAGKISVLLNHHQISLMGGQYIICMLRNAGDGNNVQVAIAEPAAPPKFTEEPASSQGST